MNFQFLVAASLFDAAVDQLRGQLMLIAFVLVVIGVWEGGWRAGADPKAILGVLVKTVIVVTLIAGFPMMMTKGKEAFDDLRTKVTQATQDSTGDSQDEFKKILAMQLAPPPDILKIGDYIAYLIIKLTQAFGKFGVKIIQYFQQYAIGCLIGISPLLIGFLAVSYTQNIGIKFLLASTGVIMWSLGMVLIDIFLYYLGGGKVMGGMLSAGIGAGAAGVLAIVSWPAAIGTMVIAFLVPTFFYLATPIAVASLMSGANASTAAAWGGLSNMTQTSQHFSRGGEALQKMRMASSLRGSSGEKNDSKNPENTGGKIERPPNPIV